jgi:hypothetical protein
MSYLKRIIQKFASEKFEIASSGWAGNLVEDETIVSSIWIIPSETEDDLDNDFVELDASVVTDYVVGTPSYSLAGQASFTDTQTGIFISGGNQGEKIEIENRVTTSRGCVLVERVIIDVIG